MSENQMFDDAFEINFSLVFLFEILWDTLTKEDIDLKWLK